MQILGGFTMKIHITKQGETIEEVASKYSVSNQDLIGINPHLNLTSDLVPGLKLKIPDIARTDKKNDHIEKFYPNLEYDQKLKEQTVPIGLKPFPNAHPEATATSTHHTPEYTTPWSHLNEHAVPLNTQSQPYHPWNPGHHAFSSYDMRIFIPPLPYYPSYPYPYAYPPYGLGFPLPFPGFGFGHGFHGGGHFGGHHHR
jgi:LysM repeat protein